MLFFITKTVIVMQGFIVELESRTTSELHGTFVKNLLQLNKKIKKLSKLTFSISPTRHLTRNFKTENLPL